MYSTFYKKCTLSKSTSALLPQRFEEGHFWGFSNLYPPIRNLEKFDKQNLLNQLFHDFTLVLVAILVAYR